MDPPVTAQIDQYTIAPLRVADSAIRNEEVALNVFSAGIGVGNGGLDDLAAVVGGLSITE